MRDDGIGVILLAVLIVGLIISAPIVAFQYIVVYPTEKVTNVTVKEKWIKQKDKSADYLFSDQYGNVHKINDDIWYWKFNSSDQYALIQPNHTYTVKECGWRTEWMSEYPNVINILQ